LSFQLSGLGDGFTRSWDIVMMVPNSNTQTFSAQRK
jgi:hypothetical protein